MAVAQADEYNFPSPIPSPPCDYVNVDGQCEPWPDQNRGNFKCCDGTNSHATHRNGACSHHGGICGGSFSSGSPNSRLAPGFTPNIEQAHTGDTDQPVAALARKVTFVLFRAV
jgi:hypothetical protein